MKQSLICVLVLILSCNENKKVDGMASRKLFADGVELGKKGLDYETRNDTVQSRKLYLQAIAKFIEAYSKDTSFKELGMYIPGMYTKLRMDDSARYWRNELRIKEDITESKYERIKR